MIKVKQSEIVTIRKELDEVYSLLFEELHNEREVTDIKINTSIMELDKTKLDIYTVRLKSALNILSKVKDFRK